MTMMSIQGLQQQASGMLQHAPEEVRGQIGEFIVLISQGTGPETTAPILGKLSVILTLGERHLNPAIKNMLPPNVPGLVRALAVKMGEIAEHLPVHPTPENLFRPALEIIQQLIPLGEEFLPMLENAAMPVGMVVNQIKGTIASLLRQLPQDPTKRDINTALVNMIVEKLQMVENLLPMILPQITPMLPEEDAELVTKLVPPLLKNFRIQLQAQLRTNPEFALGKITKLALESAAVPLLNRAPQGLLQMVEGMAGEPVFVNREQVPFERWSYDYKEKTEDCLENWKQRGWAVLHLLEASLKIAIIATAWAIVKLASFSCAKCEDSAKARVEVLGVLGTSFVNSAIAVWSPDSAKEIKDVGCTLSNWKWGTAYDGTRTSYFEFEARTYNWKKA